ncbi:MAG: hypothetical protein HY748_09710 [Elusimicrobia bacterium]|nr:hypothetical protein [Elusimicrobiota bacterium]
MSSRLAFAGVAGLACAGLFLAVITTRTDKPADGSRIAADGFDLDIESPSAAPQPTQPKAGYPAAASSPATAPARSESLSMLRDAVASGPLVMGARFVPPPPALSPAFSQPSEWAKKQGMFRDLLKHPASFMVRRTNLASPAKLQGFISDKARVQRYLTHPLIKAVLSSPSLLKTLIKTPGVVPAFLGSPAMQDRRSVEKLLDSPLVKEILKADGPSALAEDADFVNSVVSDPTTIGWLSRNPSAVAAFARISPAFAR